MKKQRSIRVKLILGGVIIISVMFLVVLAAVTLITIQTTSRSIRLSETRIREALVAKGSTLVMNNSMALRGMASDNALVDIRALVEATVANDADIVYGIYMDANSMPWVFARKGVSPQGNAAASQELTDSMSVWAAGIQKTSNRVTIDRGNTVIEFADAVVADGERLGTIRYGLTTNSMIQALRDARSAAIRSLLQILLTLGGIAGLSLYIAIMAQRKQALEITKPINSLVKSASLIADGEYSVEVRPESDDEIGVLSSTFETMRQTVKKYTEHLQELVDEKMKQVRDIMNTISQGLFTANFDMSINPEYSACSNVVLGFDDISKYPLTRLLRMSESDALAMADWITLIRQKHNIHRWSKLQRLAPIQELEIAQEDGEKRYVKIEYERVLDKNNELTKIMILAQDVTESRRIQIRIEEERIRHENAVKIILGIVNNPREMVLDFITDSTRRLQNVHPVIDSIIQQAEFDRQGFPESQPSDLPTETLAVLFRDFHTIKGNAGTFGFEALTALAHSAEDTLELLKPPVKVRRTDTLLTLKSKVESMQKEIQLIEEQIRLLSGDREQIVVQVARSKVEHIIHMCAALKEEKRLPDSVDSLINECERINYLPLVQLTKKYRELVNRVSTKMGKTVLFQVGNPSMEVHPDSFDDVDEALLHILRNAVDHGIETDEERRQQDKEPGRIELFFATSTTSRMIKIRDNGRGIDPKKVAEKACAAGIVKREVVAAMSETDILRLIFEPGFSTSDSISLISGRGVGLAVALKVVNALNGTLSVKSVQGKETVFSITVPRLPIQARNPHAAVIDSKA